MSRYRIDIYQTVCRLLFHPFKSAWMTDWLSALCIPIQVMNSEFVAMAERQMLIAKHSGQVGVQEHLLNELFDTSNGIYISDGTPTNETFLFNELESPTVDWFLFNQSESPTILESFVFNETEGSNAIHYVVNVPSIVHAQHAEQIYYICLNYKPAGRNFVVASY